MISIEDRILVMETASIAVPNDAIATYKAMIEAIASYPEQDIRDIQTISDIKTVISNLNKALVSTTKKQLQNIIDRLENEKG